MWDVDGKIYSWGDGSDGKLGHGTIKGKYNYIITSPIPIKAMEEHRIMMGSCGFRHTVALTYKGEIF